VLPSEEPAHELRGGHGRDFLPQSSERQAMDAREQASIAPFE
jgi:hypothetical protein